MHEQLKFEPLSANPILVRYMNRLYVPEHAFRGHKSTQATGHPKFSGID